MDIKQIRLRNLRTLISEAGTIASLARLSKTAPAYLSQILNSLPTSTGRPRSVGDKLARKLEQAMAKPYGWMDKENPDGDDAATTSAGHVIHVPIIDESDVLRFQQEADNDTDANTEQIPVPINVGKHSFAFRVNSDSMEPKFLPGDIIVVDPDVAPHPMDYVITLDTSTNKITFKQFIEDGTKHFLKPLNPRYPLVELNDHRMLGKVVYRGEVL